jgi:hypothetical protein
LDNATLSNSGPSDPKYLLVVVLNEHDGLYTIGCREGILRAKVTPADLCAIGNVLIKPDDVHDASLSLRTAIAKATGGQGFVKCQCKTPCMSGRCSCKRQKMFCNSRCHPGITCKNVDE